MPKTIIDVFNLEDSERETFGHDWTDNVTTGTTIASVTGTATDLVTGLDVSSTVLLALTTNVTTNVTTFSIARPAGTVNPFLLTLTLNRDDGDIFKDFYLIAGSTSLVYDIISDALEMLGVVAIDNVPGPIHQANGLAKLNSLIQSLSADPSIPPYPVSETITLVASQSTYTWGPTGNFLTEAPLHIKNATVTVGNIELPVEAMTLRDYDRKPFKAQTGIPREFYYVRLASTGAISLWPVPDQAYTLYVDMQKGLSPYASITSLVSLRPEYIRMLTYNLCVDMIPLYPSIKVAQVVTTVAAASMAAVRSLRGDTVDSFQIVPA